MSLRRRTRSWGQRVGACWWVLDHLGYVERRVQDALLLALRVHGIRRERVGAHLGDGVCCARGRQVHDVAGELLRRMDPRA